MSEPRSDINQLLMQIKYNFQVFWRLVDLAEDSNVNFANCSFRTKQFQQICRRWFSQQLSLLRGKSPVFFDVRRFSNTVSGVNVTWRRIRARSNPESLISESDLELLITTPHTQTGLYILPYTHRTVSTFPLSYLILVVDICPSIK